MQNIVLRPDQQQLKNDIYTEWNRGNKNVLGVLATGGGKSIIGSDIFLDNFNLNLPQAIIAHRNELVSQMSIHVANRGIPHRIIGSNETVKLITQKHRSIFGRTLINPSAPTAVVGVGTLNSRREHLKPWGLTIRRWAIDEAHHVLRNNMWGKAVEMFPYALGLGLTATPGRPDGQGLGTHADGVFDVMCEGIAMRQLILNHSLSDYEVVCPESDIEVDPSEVTKTGDWSTQRLKKAARKSKIVGDVLDAYLKYAYGRKTIIFATDVETANDIANKFNNKGIKTAALSAKTPTNVRDKFTEDFKNNRLDVLINVDLFDEGFDVPACDVVIMARPTMSIIKYRQQVGRALRYVPGKIALLIDMVSNVLRHGLPDDYVSWTLDRLDKRAKSEPDPEEIELKRCHVCTKPYRKFLTECPYCGAEPPLPEPTSRTLEKVDGDFILLDRDTLAKMRKNAYVETPAEVASRTANVAGNFAARGVANKQIERVKAWNELKTTIDNWADIQLAKGLTERQIHKKFYLTLNASVLDVLNVNQTRLQLDATRMKVEKWLQ